MIDIDNIENLFTIADCHNFMNDQMTLVKCVSFDNTVKGFLYEYEGDYIMTFTPYDYKGLYSFVKTGIKLLWKQDMVKVDHGRMNRFFHDYSLMFYKEFEPYFKDINYKKLYITGISMGGAMGQCFYYHLRNHLRNRKTIIYAFGSPRIGDQELNDWFMSDRELEIKNIVLFKFYGSGKKADPVCTFPNQQDYVFNPNFYMLYEHQMFGNGTSYIKTNPTFKIRDLFYGSETCELWENIHNIGEYAKHLKPKKLRKTPLKKKI